MTEDQFLLLLTLGSFGVWVVAAFLLVRGHRLSSAQALSLLFVVGFAGVIGQLSRSLLDDGIANLLVAIVRAVYLIVPTAIVWEWITEKNA